MMQELISISKALKERSSEHQTEYNTILDKDNLTEEDQKRLDELDNDSSDDIAKEIDEIVNKYK